jgi:hypothetical protein
MAGKTPTVLSQVETTNEEDVIKVDSFSNIVSLLKLSIVLGFFFFFNPWSS